MVIYAHNENKDKVKYKVSYRNLAIAAGFFGASIYIDSKFFSEFKTAKSIEIPDELFIPILLAYQKLSAKPSIQQMHLKGLMALGGIAMLTLGCKAIAAFIAVREGWRFLRK